MKKILIIIIAFTTSIHPSFSQTNNTKKLILTNVKDGVVFIEDDKSFAKNGYYTLQLHFSNSISKVVKKPVIYKVGGTKYKTDKLCFQPLPHSPKERYSMPPIDKDSIFIVGNLAFST